MKKYSILIFNWILLCVLIKKLIKNSKTAQYEHLSVIFNFFLQAKNQFLQTSQSRHQRYQQPTETENPEKENPS